jgi:hypothetical protein
MLKVNTNKISIEEFAKKYGLKPREVFQGILYDYTRSPNLNVALDGVFTISCEHSGDTVYKTAMDTLFDMITNGDLVKE